MASQTKTQDPEGETAENNEFLSQDALDELMASMDTDGENVFDTDATEAAGDESDAARATTAPTAPSLKFATFDSDQSGPESSSGLPGFDRVEDIPLEITVELGRTHLLIRDILDLSTGSIIELEKVAGEPVDLLANGLLVARGEVIVVEDSFGVRITEIVTTAQRKEAIIQQSSKAK